MKPEDIARMNAFFETNSYDQEPADPMASEAAAADDDDTPPAAGVMYMAEEDGTMLLCQRNDTGLWAFPAGMVEPDETPREAACRELFEETQHRCDIPEDAPCCDYVDADVRFHCFVVEGPKFQPKLDREHGAFAWVGEFMPEPLHPGVAQALLLLQRKYKESD